MIILSNFPVVHLTSKVGNDFGSNLCLSRCRGLLGFFGPFALSSVFDFLLSLTEALPASSLPCHQPSSSGWCHLMTNLFSHLSKQVICSPAPAKYVSPVDS